MLLEICDKELQNGPSHFSRNFGLFEDLRNSLQSEHLIKHPHLAFSSLLPLITSVELASDEIPALISALLLVQFTRT